MCVFRNLMNENRAFLCYADGMEYLFERQTFYTAITNILKQRWNGVSNCVHEIRGINSRHFKWKKVKDERYKCIKTKYPNIYKKKKIITINKVVLNLK